MQSPPPNFFPITPIGLLGASEHRDRAGLLMVIQLGSEGELEITYFRGTGNYLFPDLDARYWVSSLCGNSSTCVYT